MKATKYSITLYEKAIEEIDAREGDRSSKINKSLERYFSALERERRELRKILSPSELDLIAESLKGKTFNSISIGMIYNEIEDSINLDKLDEKWVINGNKLVSTLKDLSYTQNLALIDAIEQYWTIVNSGKQPNISDFIK